MKLNVGKLDRYFRIVLGSVVIAFGCYFQTWLGALGIIPIITGILNWCPIYIPFGISTRKVNTTDIDNETNSEAK